MDFVGNLKVSLVREAIVKSFDVEQKKREKKRRRMKEERKKKESKSTKKFLRYDASFFAKNLPIFSFYFGKIKHTDPESWVYSERIYVHRYTGI